METDSGKRRAGREQEQNKLELEKTKTHLSFECGEVLANRLETDVSEEVERGRGKRRGRGGRHRDSSDLGRERGLEVIRQGARFGSLDFHRVRSSSSFGRLSTLTYVLSSRIPTRKRLLRGTDPLTMRNLQHVQE